MTNLQNYFQSSGCPASDGLPLTARFAQVLHGHQVDHLGQPYIYHPARVVRNVVALTSVLGSAPDTDMLTAAWLHDTIEDCGVTAPQLLKWGFSQASVDMVVAVTKPDNDPRPYAQVIDDLIATGNRGAMRIKLADNMDNLHPQRVTLLMAKNPEKTERLSARYRDSVDRLARALAVGLSDNGVAHEDREKVVTRDVMALIQSAPPITFHTSPNGMIG